MTYANPSINPIIYAFSNESFKKSFLNLFPFLFKNTANANNGNVGDDLARNLAEREVLCENK